MPIDFGKLTDKIVKRVLDNLQDSNPDVQNAGEQVGENFVEGIEQGLEDAAGKIAASSVKITKAFKDLAKRITNQKDIFNISLGGKDVVIDVDFSDIDINEEDFQKKINDIFDKFKINNAIEFDSVAAEKQFKNMLALHTKYAVKLHKLQEQKSKLTTQSSIKTNAQEQLAVIDGLKEIRRMLEQASDMSVELPHVYFGDIKELRTSISLIEQMEKGEEKVGKQRDANTKKIKKENKELREKVKILEEKVGPIEEGEVSQNIKSRTRKPKTETRAVAGADDGALQQLKRDAEAASKALSDAEKKLSAIIDAEKNLEWQLTNRNLVDYAEKYLNAADLKMRFLDDLPRSLSKKGDHKASLVNIKDIIQKLINEEALGAMGEFVVPEDIYQFKDYKFAVETGATNKELNKLLNSLVNGLIQRVNDTMDTYRSWGDIQAHDNPESNDLLAEKRRLSKEHAAAVQEYNDAADASRFASQKLREAEDKQNDVIESQNAKLAERNKLIQEYIDANRRAKAIEANGYASPADMPEEDFKDWISANETMQEMSMRLDYDYIINGVRERIGDEMKAFGGQFEYLQKELGDPNVWINQYGLLMESIRQGALTAAEAVAKLRSEMENRSGSNIDNKIKSQESLQKEIEEKHAKNVVQLVDNYGDSLDEVNNKLMQGTKLLDEQGRIIRLFHNSSAVFDKFDASKSGKRQGVGTLGKGNYLHFGKNGKFNDPKYGRYQTQWYANIDKVFDAENDILSEEQINDLINKFLPGLSDDEKKNYTNKFLKKYMAHAVRYVAQKANAEIADVWKYLGYDAVQRGDEINIFDSSKIHRANDAVLDMSSYGSDKHGGPEKQALKNATGTQKEIKLQEELQKEIDKTNYVIKVQKEWLDYLDPFIRDDTFKTSGKREATAQLKERTNKLVDFRRHPGDYEGYNMYEEKVELAQAKAYKEAERQGVAQSTLQRYYTDAVFAHDENLKKLQEERALHAKILEDAEAKLVVLQQQLQTETGIEGVLQRKASRTINGKSGKFRTNKPDAHIYETDSGQMSMFPVVEQEIDTKNKLAETNNKVAESQNKVNEATNDAQMTIDDILPDGVMEYAKKAEAEAKAFGDVEKASEKATKSKKKFAGANKDVANSANTSVKGLKAEADAMEDVGDAAETAWSMTRPGVKSNSLMSTSDELDSFNLPLDYMGERGQDAVQIFAKLKNEIEAMTGKPVIIDFVSDVNDEGQLEAVGATLKYVNEEAGITVRQFYEVKRNQDGILVATQSHEKATLAAAKAAKVFNTEIQQKLALEQIATLESRMGSLKDSTGEFTRALNDARQAANNIDGEEGLKAFNLSLRVAGEKAKQLKSELKGQNTLDTVASMERSLLTFPSRLEEVRRKLKSLGDVDGIDIVDDVLRSINNEYQRFLNSDNAEEKVKLFRSLTSSMVWANAEMRNLSGKNAENKKRESAEKNAEDAKKKADRESYSAWWKSAIDEQSIGENEAKSRKKQEQTYSDWWNKALFEREQQEKAKDERVIAARKKKEEAYEAWWQKALFNREKAPNLNYGKTTANSVRRKFDATEGAVDALGVTSPEVLAKLEEYRDKVVEVEKLRYKFKNDSGAAENSSLVKQFQKASYEAEQLRRGIKAVTDEEQKMIEKSSEQGFDPIELSAGQIVNLKNEMIAHANATAQGRVEIKGWNDDHTKMYYTVTNTKGVVEEMTEALGQGTNRLYQYRTATKETGTLMQQIFRGIKVKAKELLSFVIGGGSIYKVIEILRQGVQYVREIDLALTELRKVTDETEETYDEFLKTAAKTGAKLGSTISAVTEATATFAKLGHSMKEAAEMAEAAIVYKNVGDNIASTEDAADSIISTMKGFGMEASEAMEIVDRFNEVGNRFAITSQGIGEALRLSASALNEGGNSLDESIAMITAANEVVNDPSSVGTALKTLTLRLRGSKTELEEMGEDVSDMATTTSQLQSKLLALTGGKVDIMLDANTFKNSTQILREMADAWGDMTDIQRASALELMGGKRQANVLSALIQNFETVEDVIKASENSTGSALQENEKYLDSIQGKIDQFNNAVQAMWSDTLDSDAVKFFVDLATQLVKLVDAVGPLNIAVVGLFTYLGKQQGIFDKLFDPAGDSIEELKKQLAKAEKDFTRAESEDIRKGTDKTAEKRRNAEERVNILRQKVQDASEEAVLEGIDESFDTEKVKNSIRGKKGARTKRINQLQSEGKTFDEIQADPKVKQYTKDIEDAERALDEYNATVQQTNATVQQASATTQANTVSNQANTESNTASAAAEAADASATNASAAADARATVTQDAHTASTFRELVAQAISTKMKWADVKAAGKQIILDKLRNSWLVKNAIAQGTLTATEAASAPITALLSAGIKGLAASFGALWAALWPVLLIMAAVAVAIGAIVLLVKGFDALIKTSEELREELSGLKDEISSVKDEIDSLNSELETTQERMEELLAKDSLTFTEQEELDNLQKQNDLLEREIYLLEQREKRLQREAQKTFDDLMDKETREKDRDGDGEDEVYDRSLERKMRKYEKWAKEYEDAKQALFEAEQNGDEKEIERAEKKVEKAEKKLSKWQGKVDEELNQYLEDADGIDYESADEQTRKYLDYIYNTEGRYNIANGEDQAKSVEIKRIFNKDNMSEAKDEIESLVEKLAKNPGDKNVIAQISEQCKLAEKDLKAVGLSVQDATDYFAKLGSSASFGTIDGKVAEMAGATSKLQTLLSNTNSKEFAKLFDKDGEVVGTKIAEYFQGTSEETRNEIARLVKNINDGEISVENALKQFEMFSIESSLDIYISEVQTNFKDVFVELEDADGLIDTFEELGEAIGSTASALKAFNKAEGEMANSGRVSIETALQLMEYTDDYGSVLQVVDGKLQLVDNAEEALIQTRIDAIRTSAEASLSDATNAYNKAQLATQTYREALTTDMSAEVVASAWEKVLAAGAGLLAGIKSIITEETWTEAYNRAYNETLSNITGYETSYDDAGLQALVDAEADAKKAMDAASDRVELANQLTPETLESINDADDVDSKEDAANDAFQKEVDYWENRIAANQARYEQLQNEIDLLEAKGQKADASFYEEQIELEKEREWLLGEQKKAAQAHLATLEEGSEEWWEVANTLNDIEGELDDVTSSILDLQDAIAEIDTYKFEEFNTRLDNLTSKLETIRNLIAPDGEEDWFDDDGNWTESGVAVLGSYLQELETYKQGYKETVDELDKYAASYEGNEAYYEALGIHSEQEWYDKTEELISQQYDFAESISDTEQSIVDMYESNIDAVEEYTETLIDSYNDYIDSVKEALDAERDLYDFKKNVQKQAKDIAAIERRIASLSGSTNAADIAERRKLEAQLYESRESLNDTYYDHAKNAQSEALDREAEAYETSMNNMIEGLRTSLEAATTNMDEFLMGVTSMVMYNADTVLAKYEETNLPLTKELTNPWEEAKKATSSYSGNALDLMNQWTKEGGFFAQFNSAGTTNLQSPWSVGTTAANSFKTSVSTVMSGVVSNIATNVKTASGELSKLYQQIQDTEKRAASANVAVTSSGSSSNSGSYVAPQKKYYVTAFLDLGSRSLSITKSDSSASEAMSAAKVAILGEYEKVKGNSASAESAWLRTWRDRVKYTTQYYAKGTTGTPSDEWALTDEPRFGDELVLVPGKDGNLSFMRKGTGVVPADLTANLMEWGQFTPDSMNLGGGVNVNMINNAVNKPEFNFAFDALVKAENITEETLPAVKKLVTQELNRFTKELNYALKGKGAR